MIDVKVGQKIVFLRDAYRTIFNGQISLSGLVGEVTKVAYLTVEVKILNETIEDLKEWDNCLQYIDEEDVVEFFAQPTALLAD